jgi:hypothetical protein
VNYRGVLLVGLGIALVLFYVTFVTARTYYNPSATLLIILLGAFISVGGLLNSMKHDAGNRVFSTNPLISKVRRLFPALFLLTVAALSVDVIVTLYAVSSFGLGVETNKVVASLISRGDLLAWLGQQFAPALITGILFWLSRNIYVRSMAAFFMLGTLGYAAATVLNDALVVYDLSILRA